MGKELDEFKEEIAKWLFNWEFEGNDKWENAPSGWKREFRLDVEKLMTIELNGCRIAIVRKNRRLFANYVKEIKK